VDLTSASSDGHKTTALGSNDVWVVKLSSSGALVWETSLGGSASDIGYGVIETTDNGLVIAGSTRSTDGHVSEFRHSSSYYEAWVVKLDSTGALVWETTFGGNNSEILNNVIKTSDGGFAVVGAAYSMDGDICDLPALVDLKQRYGCLLMVDEAHSFGIVGKTGQGVHRPDQRLRAISRHHRGSGSQGVDCPAYLAGP